MASNDSAASDLQGSRNSSTGGMDLQFVSMNASSPLEKQRNKKIIRSTAMRSFRRKKTPPKVQEKPTLVREVSQDGAVLISSQSSLNYNSRLDRTIENPYISTNGTEFPSNTSWSYPTSDSSRPCSNNGESNSVSVSDEENGLERRLPDHSPTPSSITGSPISPLGAGRVDPFRIYPVGGKSNIPELFDHSVAILWPGLGPETQMPTAWFRKAWEKPILMHALAFGAIVHMDVLRSPRISLENPLRLFHKVQTMTLLKEEMKNPDATALDDVILAVLALSTNEVETVANHMKEKVRSPFNSPLPSIQWLDVYGSITHVKAHTLAMRSLVARRGGLENVELPGLAETLSLSDVLGATQSLCRPHFPLLAAAKDLPALEIDRMLRLSLRNLGRGFESLNPFGINESALGVIRNMVDVSMVIDGHTRGVRPITDMAAFVLKRNATQHSLMSLASGEELGVGEVSSICLYDSIRHAVMIYSTAVTFPLPPLTGIFGKLATALKNIMETSKFDPCWQLCPKTLLWILVLGGIAASGTKERAWYVQNVEAVSGALKLLEWQDVVDNIEEYLWLESACDTAGRILWDEVVSDRFLQAGV
ncbi:hypothetical protein ONS95_000264 [Cadophora gregata]|uniref:uncharacterized protein n=1 Tax=Cadophora gregata TaxID=51156 RepID=UPI0026DD95D8|nr:uncharacterized protein ONS95_000264 [Cadophora gregata]KAK0099539.1 hypothetical protein ONS96_008373 [Cadophora gregata f. sp. sojae]KAK0112577.1 hypothetical protein ONS96_001812 [Cadophora gregata f. sp. sojae]KAK0125737.1 hypothetical protein ONS96_009568 [Cadophora gregata f. sp. sojae]KAK0128289.1 hypothetical protein ONS95_000264 [Cadophora gregata]